MKFDAFLDTASKSNAANGKRHFQHIQQGGERGNKDETSALNLSPGLWQ